MYDTAIAIAGILGVSLILSVLIHASARLRIEQQRTLQKLLERGDSIDGLSGVDGFGRCAPHDLRRGILLVAIGAVWSLVTFFIGGRAWILGVVPMAIGLAYVLLWKLDDGPR